MFRLQAPSSVVLLALAALASLLAAPIASPAQGRSLSEEEKTQLKKALMPSPSPVRAAPSRRRLAGPRVPARPSPEHSDSAIELLEKLEQARKILADTGALEDSLKVDLEPSADAGARATVNWSLRCPDKDADKLLDGLGKVVREIPELDVTSLKLGLRTKKDATGTITDFMVDCRATLGVPRAAQCLVETALAARKASAEVGLDSDNLSLVRNRARVQVRITGTAPGGREAAHKVWRVLLEGLRSDKNYVFPRSLSVRPFRDAEEERTQFTTSMDLMAR